jgi:osmoprotectant transport system permease protein
MKLAAFAGVVLAAVSLQPAPLLAAERIVVGSKAFTEGYVLGEIAAQTLESATKAPVTRKLGMGSTGIVFQALRSGAIDVYSDYTGTLAEAILKRPDLRSVDEIQRALAEMDLVMSPSAICRKWKGASVPHSVMNSWIARTDFKGW